ncbi:DUF167 domain-containing protein [Rubritalea spongiae]|uniref:UPF0235 protein ACFSQZ_13155 n=1 Tax=Rubritalea spongiae TaxID=430797 RepID=A0ABW5E4Z0_9BACT
MACRIQLKVIPGSTRNEIVGWLEQALKVKVQAAPEKGKANKVVVKLLSKELGIPAGQIEIIAGTLSQRKTVEIKEHSMTDILNKLPTQ